MTKSKYPKGYYIELSDNQLEAVIELITSNNEYNDQDDVNFWNDIIKKLDPNEKYTQPDEKHTQPEDNRDEENTKSKNMYVTHSKGDSL